MAGELAYAWLRQADSDLAAANRAHDPADGRTACQAVAKHQQAVEKSVKAVVAALNDRGTTGTDTGFSHDVGRLVSAVTFLSRRAGTRDVQVQIASIFHEGHRLEIAALSTLAPKRPERGRLAARNTEYPYQNADGSWRAPADPDGFTDADVKRFRRLAGRLLDGASRVVAAVYR